MRLETVAVFFSPSWKKLVLAALLLLTANYFGWYEPNLLSFCEHGRGCYEYKGETICVLNSIGTDCEQARYFGTALFAAISYVAACGFFWIVEMLMKPRRR